MARAFVVVEAWTVKQKLRDHAAALVAAAEPQHRDRLAARLGEVVAEACRRIDAIAREGAG